MLRTLFRTRQLDEEYFFERKPLACALSIFFLLRFMCKNERGFQGGKVVAVEYRFRNRIVQRIQEAAAQHLLHRVVKPEARDACGFWVDRKEARTLFKNRHSLGGFSGRVRDLFPPIFYGHFPGKPDEGVCRDHLCKIRLVEPRDAHTSRSVRKTSLSHRYFGTE